MYSTPESFAFLKLIGLKILQDFFFLFAAASETVHYKDLDLFFLSILL